MDLSLEQKVKLLQSLRSPSNTVYYAIMPLGDMLLVLFLTLKLGGWGIVANWSWWVVTCPFWIPMIAAILKKYIPLVRKYLTLNEQKVERPILNIEDLAPDDESIS